MNKNIYNYFLHYSVLNIFFFTYFMHAMHTQQLPSHMKKRIAAGKIRSNTPELPDNIGQRIAAERRARELARRAEGYVQLAVPIGQKTPAGKIASLEPKKEELDRQHKQEQIKALGETNNIYIYDESGADGYCLTQNMWDKSQTLKDMMTNLGENEIDIASQAHSFHYSSDVIKTIAYILKVCENVSKENPCNDAVQYILGNISFQTAVSTLICADETLNIDKELLTELVKKVEQKIIDLLDGNMISIEDIQALDTMQLASDLRKQLLGVKWGVFVEKFKLSVIKKCSYTRPDNQPKLYTYGDPGDPIFYVLFSPNNKYLSLQNYKWDEIWNFRVFKSSHVIDMNTMNELKKVEKNDAEPALWINNDTLVCSSGHSRADLTIFKCKEKEIIEEKKAAIKRNFFFVDNIMHYQDIIIFSAWSSITGFYIGEWDYKKSDMVKCSELRGIEGKILHGNHSKIIKIAGTGEPYMVLDSHKESGKTGFYKVVRNGQEWLAVDEIATFDGIVSSVIINPEGNRLATIVGENRLDMGIYSLETKSYTLFKGKKKISSLIFSPDGKIVLAACSDELSIISAITGEKIGEFRGAGGQAFALNHCVAFNSDGTMLAIGRDVEQPGLVSGVMRHLQEVFMISSKPSSSEPNLLIWKWLPDKYVSIFTELYNKPLSFECIKLLVSLFNRIEDNKNPIQLTDGEKTAFEYLSNSEIGLKIKNMLTETHYVSYPPLPPKLIPPKINEWQE